MYRKACGGFERVLGTEHAETKKLSIDFEHLLEEVKEMEVWLGCRVANWVANLEFGTGENGEGIQATEYIRIKVEDWLL